MKRIILTAISVFFVFTQAFSAYIENMKIELKQPDGEIIKCFASGDEFHNWAHDANNYMIIQDDNGYYVYAIKKNNVITPSRYIVGKVDPLEIEELIPNINISPVEWRTKREQYYSKNMIRKNIRKNEGVMNNIVILVRFNDDPEFDLPADYFEDMHNHNDPDSASMYRYFQEVSYGKLEVFSHIFPVQEGSTTVSYKDSLPRAYFEPSSSANPNGYASDGRMKREQDLIARILRHTQDSIPDDLNIDFNNDGVVDNLCFIIYGQTGVWATLLWPHMGDLSALNWTLKGKQIGSYNFQIQSSIDESGVGVLCHEFFHSLGAPDLYHYGAATSFLPAVGEWDIMGKHLNPPQHPSAYIKYRYGGWIDSIPEISEDGLYSLHTYQDTAKDYCVKVRSEYSNSEYFILEYRKQMGLFERSLLGSGIIIYRVNSDFDGEGNMGFDPGNRIYDELYVYRPGGMALVLGDIQSANFSAETGRTMFNSSTEARCLLSDDSDGDLQIHSISACNDSITFYLSKSYINFNPDTAHLLYINNDSCRIWVDTDCPSFSARTESNWIRLEVDSVQKIISVFSTSENTLSRRRMAAITVEAFGVSTKTLWAVQEKSNPASLKDKSTPSFFVCNPSQNCFQVNFSENLKEAFILKITNMQGQVLYSKQLHDRSSHEVCLPDHVKGYVILSVESAQSKASQKILIY